MLLLRDALSLPGRCPGPAVQPQQLLGPAVQGQPWRCTGASVPRGERGQRWIRPWLLLLCSTRASPSPRPAVPLQSPKRVLHRALGPAVLRRFPLRQRCGVAAGLAHGHGELFCTPGKELQLLQPCQGHEATSLRRAPSYPRDSI